MNQLTESSVLENNASSQTPNSNLKSTSNSESTCKVPSSVNVTDSSKNSSMTGIPCPRPQLALHRTTCSQTTCNSTNSGIFCRICHDGDQVEELIAPCNCSGTMGMLHRSCIEKWLSTVESDRCEICGFRYHTERHPRPFSEWFLQPAHHSDRRNLLGDGICFLLLTPLAAVSVWLCISGAQKYTHHGTGKWETMGLVTLSILVIIIYLIWCLLAFRYHVRIYSQWRRTHQVVHIKQQSQGADDERTHSDDSPDVVDNNTYLGNSPGILGFTPYSNEIPDTTQASSNIDVNMSSPGVTHRQLASQSISKSCGHSTGHSQILCHNFALPGHGMPGVIINKMWLNLNPYCNKVHSHCLPPSRSSILSHCNSDFGQEFFPSNDTSTHYRDINCQQTNSGSSGVHIFPQSSVSDSQLIARRQKETRV